MCEPLLGVEGGNREDAAALATVMLVVALLAMTFATARSASIGTWPNTSWKTSGSWI